MSELAAYARLKWSWAHEYYSFQCGAFDRSESAHRFANDLRRKGLQAVVEVDLRGNHARHMVHVGRYANFLEAEANLPRVRQIVPDAYVVP